MNELIVVPQISSGYEPGLARLLVGGKVEIKSRSQGFESLEGESQVAIMATSDGSVVLETGYKTELLRGSGNYRTWKFSIRMALLAKDLWDVVGGDEVDKPAEDVVVWEKKARKALAVIALSVSPTEQERIIDCTTPKQAWDIFSKLYEGHGRNRKFMLLQELFQMSISGFMGMDEYLRRVREKMSELAIIGTKLEDDVKLALILNGLPE